MQLRGNKCKKPVCKCGCGILHEPLKPVIVKKKKRKAQKPSKLSFPVTVKEEPSYSSFSVTIKTEQSKLSAPVTIKKEPVSREASPTPTSPIPSYSEQWQCCNLKKENEDRLEVKVEHGEEVEVECREEIEVENQEEEAYFPHLHDHNYCYKRTSNQPDDDCIILSCGPGNVLNDQNRRKNEPQKTKEFLRNLFFLMGRKSLPTVNGKEVNLDLLYQIVTSHGGWEKVNNRNEWDDLLEHFNLPRGTNGGLVIKQIYLKYLETYEKIYFLGEDVHNNDDGENDYDDYRARRRHAHKVSSRSNSHVQGSADQQQSQHQQLPVPIPEHLREQLGLSTQLLESTDYDRLLLSLQSPLPNDQDVAISICTLLSNNTKHVLKFSKCPAVLNLLLAHAGIYQHCGLRMLMEEIYIQGRSMNHAEFWEEIVEQIDIKPFLCESYVDRIQTSLGLNEEDSTTVELDDLNESEIMDEDDTTAMKPTTSEAVPETIPSESETILEEDEEDLFSPSDLRDKKPGVDKENSKQFESASCCSTCPCQRIKTEFDNIFPRKRRYADRFKSKTEVGTEDCSLPFCLTRSAGSDDKVGQRISQIANILKNLSFEEDNFSAMASNPTLLRYLLITANCSWGNLPQISFDVLGNIAGHIKLQDPMKDPISSMLLTLVSSGLFSPDRFKVLRSLEILRELTKIDRNERIIVRYLESKVYKRMCELLTICDIMMLIYTLECILSMTGLGEAVCNELVRVKGSVATLVSLVTVEAQSYGPKGCILMRVVETVTGSSQSTQISSTQSQTAGSTTVSQTIPASSTSPSTPQQSLQSSSPASVTANSIPSIGLRTVTGYTVVPPAQQQQQTAGQIGYAAQQPATTSQHQMTMGTVNLLNVNSPIQPQPQVRTVFRASPCNTVSPISTTTLQPVQVQISRSGGSVSPSLTLNPPISPIPGPIAQIQGKSSTLPVMSNHLNATLVSTSTSSTHLMNSSNSVILMSSTSASTPSTNSIVNHINHAPTKSVAAPAVTTGAGAIPVLGSLAQVSSHSISQQVYSPSINLVTPKGTLSEEGWATAWVKGAFESSTGTSIEQGEIYRMYCTARNNPTGALLMDQFIQCVKSVYGANVGPVIKPFMSTSLTFIEGIRPKITLRPTGSVGSTAAGTTVTNSVVTVNASHVAIANNETQSLPMVSTSNGIGGSKNLNSTSTTAATVRSPTPVQLPVSVHIPSPLSPILKATLSRPPTPKSPPGEKRGRTERTKRKKNDASKISSVKKKNRRNPATIRTVNKEQATAKILSPSSSAIRTLLASKVAQRQQKKLQQQQTKGSKSKMNSIGSKSESKTKLKPAKMNGVETGSEVGEESSTSSSLISNEGFEIKSDPLALTFKGVLCNGINSEEASKVLEPMELEVDGLDESGKNSRIKGMLVDLLERKVLPRDSMNGLIGREIRISDKGLELIEKDESESVAGVSLMNNALGLNDSQEPQQMTFYASPPEVVSSSRIQNTVSTDVSDTSGTVLLSGGGGLKVQQAQGKPQLIVNKMLDQGASESDNVILTGGADGDGISISSSETSSNGGGGDLLEKFSQFSDLIVVNPEQLGLKRNASTLNSEGTTESSDQAPPIKKPTLFVNGSDVHQAAQSSSTGPISGSPSVLQAALSLSAASSSNISCSTSDVGPVTLTSVNNNNQMMHLPVRLSVNPQNPTQLTFARQLVINPSGQQFLLSTPGTNQSGVSGIQGQVIISKPSGSSNDQIPKAIIILQSQPQNHPGSQTTSQTLPVAQGQVHNSLAHNVIRIMARREGVPPSEYSNVPYEQLEQELPFLCEWTGCSLRFNRHQQVYMHAINAHCPESLQEAVRCEWGANGCDPLLRKRYSIMTHLQDRHCSKQALELAMYRRKNKIEPPPAPQQPIHHPGYAPNAAFHAIKRHALQFVSPKEMADENEGPVTKSIRLTSALILRNLVNFSTLGKRILGGYESHLSSIAMSNVESSRTIAQLLHDMSESS